MPAGARNGADSAPREDRPTLGSLLRAWRERVLLTQEQLAERAGLNVRTIRRLEGGELQRPRSASVRLLAEALGLDAEERATLAAAARGRPAEPEGVDPGGPGSITAVAGLPSIPWQLPADVVDFVGRARELAVLDGVLDAAATVIIAIDGMAGVGKTALAVHFGHSNAERFPDGQLYLNLRGDALGQSMDPAEALGRLLRSLGLPPERIPAGEQEQAALYRSLLAGKRMLVVLDNARGVTQVEPLLPGGPGCLMVITSRTTLATADGVTHLHLDILDEREALAMLARLAGPERVAAQPDAAGTLVRLCGLLPLAIRIAGARLAARPAWPIATLVDRLADRASRLDELQAGDRAVRASFAVSHHALRTSEDPVDREAARAFRLLGVLDWVDMSVPVAAALLDVPQPEAHEALERLVDDQLLDLAAPGRYHAHDLLRLYARDLAGDVPEPQRLAASRRALDCYLAAAETANLLLNPATYHVPVDPVHSPHGGFTLTNPADATAWTDAERTNLLAVTRQAVAAADPAPALAVRLTTALTRPFDLRGHWQDLIAMRRLAARAARRLHDHRDEAFALQDLGWAYVRTGVAAEKAITTTRRALAIWSEIGDRRCEQACLNILGFAYRQLARYGEAATCLEKALVLCREIGHRYGEATTQDHLGLVYQRLRRFDDAIVCHRRSLAINREIGHRYGEATAIGNTGWAHLRAGDADEAIACYEESVTIAREVGDRYQEAESLWGSGQAHHALGHADRARAHWRHSIAILQDIGALADDEARALRRQATPRTPEIIQRNT